MNTKKKLAALEERVAELEARLEEPETHHWVPTSLVGLSWLDQIEPIEPLNIHEMWADMSERYQHYVAENDVYRMNGYL